MASFRKSLILLFPLTIVAFALGCTSPTPTPTPIPTPTPTFTPIPTPTPTFTPTATPSPTPIPTATPILTPTPTLTPTATPIPPATATATPTPTAMPTATPTPSLAEVLPKVRDAVVKITAGTIQVSGVVLTSPAGYVLTTSVSLGVGPLVSVTTTSGQTYTGWIVGRDDSQNLALVKVLGVTLTGIKFGDSFSVMGASVLSLGYPVSRPGSVVPIEAKVNSVTTDFATGARFLRLDVQAPLGASGGPIINQSGDLVGINAEPSYIQGLGLPVNDQGFAKAEDSIRPALQGLLNGLVNLSAPRPTPTADSGSPPPIPLILDGNVLVKGTQAATGTKLYARIVNQALGDAWFATTVKADGTYQVVLGVINANYVNSPVEFYVEGVKSATVSKFAPVVDPATNVAQAEFTVNLTFP